MYEIIFAWIMLLPQFHAEQFPRDVREAQVRPIAAAIARYAEDQELAAIAVSIGHWETKFLERIQAGRCRPATPARQGECDWSYKEKRFKARGFFQMQRETSLEARQRWDEMLGIEQQNVNATVEVAMNRMRRGRTVCRSVEGAISYYAFGHCRWPQATRRGATVRKLLGRRAKVDAI